MKIVTVLLLCLQLLFLSCFNASALAVTGDSFPIPYDGLSGYKGLGGPNYPLIKDTYFTDDIGNILMIVNVLGEVSQPGQKVVAENADLADVLAVSGGTTQNSNLKKIVVTRKEPDKNGIRAYKVDMRAYFSNGDRSSFITIKPNDTIIVPEKIFTMTMYARVASIAAAAFTVYALIHNNVK